MSAASPLRRVLVTGSGGFVGTHLMRALTAALPAAELNGLAVDITDGPALRQEVRKVRPDACVHLAAVAAIPAAQGDPDLAWRVNLGGTLALARALAEEAPGATMLFVSTADAYGRSFAPGLPVTEQSPLAPMNTYGATKAAADLALGAMVHDNLRIIRVRPFNHTGPGQSEAFVVAAFARQVARIAARQQEPLLRVGALDPRRDFLDVRDVCALYVQCLVQASRLPSGTILNVASGTTRRIGDVLAELLALGHVDAEVVMDPGRLRSSEITVAVGDATKARELLGWTPRISWSQTLADTLRDWTSRVAEGAA